MSAKPAPVPQHIIHNDEPVYDPENDHFEQKHIIEAIATSLGKHVDPPFVASLNGDWGQGKTSILKAVFEEITGEVPEAHTGKKHNGNYPRVRVVWFEAWRFQHDPTPIVALLNEIRNQLGKMSRFSKALRRAGKLGEITVESGLQTLTNMAGEIIPFAGTGGLVENVKRNGEAWEQRQHSYALPSQTIRELLDKAVKDILDKLISKHDKNRLIIIIDDLDRCQPKVAYKLLEGLKVFLNLKSCAFLIGSNRAELVRALKVSLSEESGGKEIDTCDADEYFEKLCSYCWDLPFPTINESKDYVCYLLEKDPLAIENKKAEMIRKALSNTENRVLPANPRRLKSYANVVLQLARTNSGVETSMDLQDECICLLSIAYIKAFLPKTYRNLLSNPLSFQLIYKASADAFPGVAKSQPEGDGETMPEESGMPEEGTLQNRWERAFSHIVLSEDEIRYAPPESSRYYPDTSRAPQADDQLGATKPGLREILAKAAETREMDEPKEPKELFRMAPVLATSCIPTKDLIEKYLPHALR